MRLLECKIENFGKLHDISIDFSKDVHTVCVENGWGKSTLAAFLKAMFYGLANDRSRDDRTKERVRYKPWQGGTFGGRIVFEQNQKKYLVYRTFGDRAKEDTFSLYDYETNLPSKDYSEKLGEELFHIGEESFGRTVFFHEGNCTTAVSDDIHAMIHGPMAGNDDMAEYEAIHTKLDGILSRMRAKRGNGGSIQVREERIQRLNRTLSGEQVLLNAFNKKQEIRQELKEDLETYKCSRARILEEQKQVAAMQRQIELEKNLVRAKEEMQKKEELYFTRKSMFPKGIPTEREFLELEELVENIQNSEREILALEKQAVAEQERKNREQKERLRKLCIAVLCFIGGIFLLGKQAMTGAMVLFGGTCVSIIFATISGRNIKNKRDDSYEQNETENNNEQSVETTQNNFYELEIKRIQQEQAMCEKNLEDWFNRYGLVMGDNPGAALKQLQQQLLQLQNAEQNYLESKANYEACVKECDCPLQEKKQSRTLQAIQEELLQIDAEQDKVTHQLYEQKQEMEELERQLEECQRAREELERLHLEQQEELAKEQQLFIVQSKLKEAHENLSKKYAPKLLVAFQSYYKLLGADDMEYCMDASSKLSFHAYGERRDIDKLSQGYQDLIGLCYRIALVDAMYETEKPMLILDDPFANLDDEKLEKAKQLLKSVSSNYQILYFTCSNKRSLY